MNYCRNNFDGNEGGETGIARIDFAKDSAQDDFYFSFVTFFSMFILISIDLTNRYRFRVSDGKVQGGLILPFYVKVPAKKT